MHPSESGRRSDGIDVAIAALLALAYTTAAWKMRQEPYWSDGRGLVEIFSLGGWTYHHVLYFPVAHLVKWALTPVFHLSPRELLELLSAGATGIALALTFCATRSFGVGRTAALLGALVLASTPTVWFYATCAEVHPLHLAASAGTLLWIVRSNLAGNLGRDALVPALFFCLLFGTHASAVLCAPALFLLTFRGSGRWSWPRRVWLAVLVGAAFALLWRWENGKQGAGQRFSSMAVEDLGRGWDFDFAWRELFVSAGMLYPLALALALVSVRRDARVLLRPLPLAFLVLLLTFVPFAMTFIIKERGAYYSWAMPVLALCSGKLLDLFGSWKIPLAVAIIALHAFWAREDVRAWKEDYPHHDWVPVLQAEAGENALVITLYAQEWVSVRNHSPMDAIHPPERVFFEPEQVIAPLCRIVDDALADGRTVAVTRTFFEADFASFQRVIREVIRRHGEPRPGKHFAYVLFGPVEKKASG